jgi:Ca2+-binding EF-hand superfamily protein
MTPTATQWFSNEAYKLFESFIDGEIDRVELNKLMTAATIEAKAMEKEQMIKFTNDYLDDDAYLTAEHYYNETYEK